MREKWRDFSWRRASIGCVASGLLFQAGVVLLHPLLLAGSTQTAAHIAFAVVMGTFFGLVRKRGSRELFPSVPAEAAMLGSFDVKCIGPHWTAARGSLEVFDNNTLMFRADNGKEVELRRNELWITAPEPDRIEMAFIGGSFNFKMEGKGDEQLWQAICSR